MNNSFEIIAIYEAILTITGRMLKAAQSADWERLITLEHECRGLTKKLMISDKNKVLSNDLRQRKQEIIQQILADDAEKQIAKHKGEKLILVRHETSPEDVGGMWAAQGILT